MLQFPRAYILSDSVEASINEIDTIRQMADTLDKIKEEDLDTLATDALNDACYPGNPREATKEQVIEMFRMLMA